MKMGAYLSRHFARSSLFRVSNSLTRRMSLIERAVLDAMDEFRSLNAKAFETALQLYQAPFYFVSSVGEIESTLKVIESILQKSLPVSPTAFQQSVHNAPAAYALIQLKLQNPQLTFSSGDLSLDLALSWAEQKIKLGQEKAIILLAADEDREGVRVEVCGLSDEDIWDSPVAEFSYLSEARAKKLGPEIERIRVSERSDTLGFVPLRLGQMPQSFLREAHSFDGDSLSSVWERI